MCFYSIKILATKKLFKLNLSNTLFKYCQRKLKLTAPSNFQQPLDNYGSNQQPQHDYQPSTAKDATYY